jgi:hypothetical protein
MPRPIKGSDEAKSKMSHLRSLRKKKSTKDAVESKSEASTESSKEEAAKDAGGKKDDSGTDHHSNTNDPASNSRGNPITDKSVTAHERLRYVMDNWGEGNLDRKVGEELQLGSCTAVLINFGQWFAVFECIRLLFDACTICIL